MAIRTNKWVLGEYSGAIDSVVLSKWNDIDVMKSRTRKRKKKTKSEKLKQQNTVFGMVSKFLNSARELIETGYQKPKVVKMTPFNAAVSYHLENAVIGDPKHPSLDLQKIKFTSPIQKTQSVWNPVLSSAAENTVTVTWELNPFPQKCTQLDDQVILVFCDSTYNQFSNIYDEVKRSDLSYTKTFHKRVTGHEFYWYLFLVSADGKLVSETEYIGKVTMTA